MAELRFIDDPRADRADEWWPEDKAKARREAAKNAPKNTKAFGY